MKYYLITYSAQARFNGMRVYFSKAIDSDPVDYFISVVEQAKSEKMCSYSDFAINFFCEINKEQYSKLKH